MSQFIIILRIRIWDHLANYAITITGNKLWSLNDASNVLQFCLCYLPIILLIYIEDGAHGFTTNKCPQRCKSKVIAAAQVRLKLRPAQLPDGCTMNMSSSSQQTWAQLRDSTWQNATSTTRHRPPSFTTPPGFIVLLDLARMQVKPELETQRTPDLKRKKAQVNLRATFLRMDVPILHSYLWNKYISWFLVTQVNIIF